MLEKYKLYSRYSVRQDDSWRQCDHAGENGEIIDPRHTLNEHTKGINCPFDLSRKKPVLVRVETEYNTGVSVGLPIFARAKVRHSRLRCQMKVVNCDYIPKNRSNTISR